MRRISVQPRRNLHDRARETGFEFVSLDGKLYWDESAYYAFSLKQIDDHIERPTKELAALCLDLVDRVVGDEPMLRRLKIPDHAWDLIAESWRRRDPTLYGRFDLAYDGRNPARLLEYNADTPTALFEAAVFQWGWLEDAMAQNVVPVGADQFNALHDTLIARFADIGKAMKHPARLHLACMPHSIEDRGLIAYLADCAMQAGLRTRGLLIGDIGDKGKGAFVDLDNRPIQLLFKLYPWEWMFADPFSHSVSMHETRFIEPPWKAVLSNKGILPLLWAMAPGHPNLLPAYFEDDPAREKLEGRYARKPLYSREGSNIALVDGGRVLDRDDGPYGRDGFIWQALAELPACDGNFPVIGSWIIGEEACGIGIREDTSPITKNTSRFVPHAILG
jgi:glutathionylspermidine synthase